MADWIVSAQSSGTATAEINATQGKTAVLYGVNVFIVGGGSTASIITLHTSQSATAGYSSMILAKSTGGNINILGGPHGIIKARNIKLDATSNLGTSNTVVMWGEYE